MDREIVVDSVPQLPPPSANPFDNSISESRVIKRDNLIYANYMCVCVCVHIYVYIYLFICEREKERGRLVVRIYDGGSFRLLYCMRIVLSCIDTHLRSRSDTVQT